MGLRKNWLGALSILTGGLELQADGQSFCLWVSGAGSELLMPASSRPNPHTHLLPGGASDAQYQSPCWMGDICSPLPSASSWHI